jgi:predicted glycogen debranching enzyme
VKTSTRPLLHLDSGSLLDLESALEREWLETDGSGGYASSTVVACATRRYHGLLVSAFPGNDKRHVFLTRFEEGVHSLSHHGIANSGRTSFPLGIARYRGTFHPQGHSALASFELAPHPVFRYAIGDAHVTREIAMVKGSAAVLVRWSLEGGEEELELRARPLVAFREADALTRENVDFDPEVRYLGPDKRALRLQPYAALPALALAIQGRAAAFDADPVWYRGIEYPMDLERGYDGHEDNFSPGLFRVRLRPGQSAVALATLGDPPPDLEDLWSETVRARLEALPEEGDPDLVQLAAGADDFLYRTRQGRLGVVAGFPWFGEWGRDTFLSLPGLLLARDRVAECGEALASATKFLRRGLLPNIFGSRPETSHYGSVDASLWFARAVRLFELAGGDAALLEQRLRPALVEIAESYERGTDLGIAADDGGLIRAGDERLNATWMDAVAGGVAVTPRDGCAVEINALWYLLLAQLELAASRAGRGREAGAWRTRRERAGRSFLERFWLDDARYLADVWKDGVADASVRPNMVIAAALELSPLDADRRAGVVDRAERELLTPVGLRTLGPGDPRYRGHYRGGPDERDRSYHQGTVWPWLTGFYVEAALRARGTGDANVAKLRRLLAGFHGELSTHGILHVAEVFDGDPPHRPGGTFAQAWNTAELLRARRLLDSGLGHGTS